MSGPCEHDPKVTYLSSGDPLAIAAVEAIRRGDVEALQQLLAEHPQLATVRLGNELDTRASTHDEAREGAAKPKMSRTLLHVATDWPGHFPRAVETVAALVEAGADVNARFDGPHRETPLHWAASCDDVAVLDELLDRGADIEADGAVIANGTPIADATAFGQWNAARRLIQRGAATNLWQSAAMGLLDRVKAHFNQTTRPTPEEITQAFWLACHGGQSETAEFLLARGADINWVGYDQLTALDAARRSEAHDLADWLERQGGKTASACGP
jgi:ankyrin repeat protein